MNEYTNFLQKYGSDRKAAKALGLTRTQFNNKYRKAAGLCVVVSCDSPPKKDCTRCEAHLQKAKSKKSKEELSVKNRLYRIQNLKKLNSYQREYQRKNLPIFRKARKKYDQTEAGKLSGLARRSRRLNFEDQIMSTFELDYLKSKQPDCLICGPGKKISLDHFKPLSKGGRLTLDNTITLCLECNSRKRDLNPEEFFTPEELKRAHALLNSHEKFKTVKSVKDYSVQKSEEHHKCRNFINKYHYSGTSPGAIYAFTLGFEGRVLGVCLFSKPSRQNITVPNAKNILELSRLFVVDGTPKNAESRFVGECLRWIKTNTSTEAIVSFADPTEGHEGIIYKASNFEYIGKSASNYHYETIDGIRVHKRQVWNRAKINNVSETAQAISEKLNKIYELPKNKFAFYFKK